MRRFWHWIEHSLGLNAGYVESFWLNDELWVGFRCAKCGEINGAHRTRL